MKSVYGIIFSQDRCCVLLTQRRDLPVFVLPGGGLEEGESPEAGVIREVEEEIGAAVEVIRKVAVYLPINRMTGETHFFECKLLEHSFGPTQESKSVQFFPLCSLPKRLAPPFSFWIQDAIDLKETVIKNTEGVSYTILIKLLLRHPLLVIRYFLSKLGIRYNQH